jgi:hypothetical protein
LFEPFKRRKGHDLDPKLIEKELLRREIQILSDYGGERA